MIRRLSAISIVLAAWIVILILSFMGFLFTSELSAKPSPVSTTKASWYGVGDGFHGKRTANGETFNAHALTAAHKTLRFGTQLRVTNVRTGKSVVVRINDRGPYAHGRGLDLSYAAAKAIGLRGVEYVAVEEV
jgi:rare lipoprotein A